MVYDPTSLTIVSLALVPDVEALPHIVEAVNDLLRPATIDSAVYNDLQRVVKVHGDSRAWTVKAMDGAAANGRLDIMQWLHDTRTEGCSAQACIQASKHGYLDVVKWLHEFYPTVIEPVEAMTVAAKSGHAEIVRFLRSNVAMDDAVPALQDAAVNGHVEVVDALLPYYSGLAQGAFIVASGNGQTEVVRLLLDLGFTTFFPCTVGAMDGAAARGRLDILQRLQLTRREGCSSAAFIGAAAHAHLEVLWWLGEFYSKLARPAEMVEAAAQNGHIRVVELLWRRLNDNELESAMETATKSGQNDVAVLLRSRMATAERN
eukprot:jgi/Phyca11/541441/estExt2_Genewise1Plus.C_PHYCAscaffold_60788